METKTTLTVVEMLDKIADYRFQIEIYNADCDRKIAELIPQEIKDAMEAINHATFAEVANLTAEITKLEAAIKGQVLVIKDTVRGHLLMAVYSKGAASWNNDKLEGYAEAHPEVLKFKNPSKPSVSLRKL